MPARCWVCAQTAQQGPTAAASTCFMHSTRPSEPQHITSHLQSALAGDCCGDGRRSHSLVAATATPHRPPQQHRKKRGRPDAQVHSPAPFFASHNRLDYISAGREHAGAALPLPLQLCSLPVFELQLRHQQHKYNTWRLPCLSRPHCRHHRLHTNTAPAVTGHIHLHPPTHTAWGAQRLPRPHTQRPCSVAAFAHRHVPGVVAACSENLHAVTATPQSTKQTPPATFQCRARPVPHQTHKETHTHSEVSTHTHTHTHTQTWADQAPMQWLLPRLHEIEAAAHNPSNQTHTHAHHVEGGRSDAAGCSACTALDASQQQHKNTDTGQHCK
jgi:hypothetical protein